ncbi:glutamate dehydrogenase [Firmicutes bacterium CAG:83]|nr:glutamate dehydrogenase [Firmicutes bacterium CAG:83]
MNAYLASVLENVRTKHGNEPEFVQTVEEVFSSIEPVIEKHPEYEKVDLLGRMVEPERMFTFRVVWCDDNGQWHTNRGWRCQFNGAIGPYKGGLRFQKNVYEGIIKFLGFEQTFKNSLTGLPIGGAKGGSDFDPAGKSDAEVMRFCQSFMTELQRHIGQFVDVPAGDIGVGGREIGYLFGQYKRIRDSFDGGVLTGKGLSFGGSLTRNEATGYGLCYLTEEMLHCMKQESLQGKRVAISGSGNVAIFACQKAQELGAKVITMSDSNGCIYDPEGIRLDVVKDIKLRRRGRIREYAQLVPGSEFRSDFRDLWSVPCDVALPCATQNEIDAETARRIVRGGAMALAEGANMPSTPAAIEVLREGGVLFAPAKAANAGGVAVSGLEMCQNSMRLAWTFDEVDQRLHQIMLDIFHNIYDASVEYGVPGNLLDGANIAGFRKVADAMLAQGVC